MLTFTGKNPDYSATFNPNTQQYSVYKLGELIRTAYAMKDIKSYLY